jgi:hypothetical protein
VTSSAPPWLVPLLRDADRATATIELAEQWLVASPEERETVRSGWSWGARWAYPNPGRLACTTGETGTPLQRIRAVLLLSWLEQREDSRERTVQLCELYHSCVLAGLNPAGVFEEIGATVSLDEREILERFAARPEEDRSLRAFGFAARRDVNGEMELTWEAGAEVGVGLYRSGLERADWYALRDVLIVYDMARQRREYGRLPLSARQSRPGIELRRYLDTAATSHLDAAIALMAPGMANVILLLEKA